jgi:hypothetical protein
MRITTVGNEQSNVHQNNEKIAQLLYHQMITDVVKCEPGRSARGVLIIRMDQSTGVISNNAFTVRMIALELLIERDEILNLKEKQIWLTPDEIFGPNVADIVKERVKEFFMGLEGTQLIEENNDVFAIYAQTSLVGLGALRAVADIQKIITSFNISIYCEYISPFLLRWLGNPELPLCAIAGCDPFHYGRYVLRASVFGHNHENQSDHHHTPIEPFLITRELVLPNEENPDTNIGYMIEIPDKLRSSYPEMDFRLEGDKFAWQRWMREAIVDEEKTRPKNQTRKKPKAP